MKSSPMSLLILLLISWPSLDFSARQDRDDVADSDFAQQVADEVMAAIPKAWEAYVVRDTRPVFFGLVNKMTKLREGSFGKVTSVSLQCQPGLHLALKAQKVRSKTECENIRQEVNVMRLKNSRLLPAFAYGTAKDAHDKFYILMPMADGDMLQVDKFRDRQLQGGNLQVLVFLRDMLSGLQALHSQNIVHRDIKPENTFIFCPKSTNEPCNAVLADFGVSCKRCKSISGSEAFMHDDVLQIWGQREIALRPEHVKLPSMTLWKQNDMHATALTMYLVASAISTDKSTWVPGNRSAEFQDLLNDMSWGELTAGQAHEKVNSMLQPHLGNLKADRPILDLPGSCDRTFQALLDYSMLDLDCNGFKKG